VLYGGSDGSRALDDIWVLHPSSWVWSKMTTNTVASPVTTPGPRAGYTGVCACVCVWVGGWVGVGVSVGVSACMGVRVLVWTPGVCAFGCVWVCGVVQNIVSFIGLFYKRDQ